MALVIFSAILTFAAAVGLGFGAMHFVESRRPRLGQAGTFVGKTIAYLLMIIALAYIGMTTLAISIR